MDAHTNGVAPSEAHLSWDDVPALMGDLHQVAQALLRARGETAMQPSELVLSALRRQRLSGQDWSDVRWANRAYFFGAMRKAMMRAYLDHVRAQARRRRNLGCQVSLDAISLDGAVARPEVHEAEMAALYHALEKLEATATSEDAQIAHHRLFTGLSIEEVAALMELETAVVRRAWRFAKSYLHRQMVAFLERP